MHLICVKLLQRSFCYLISLRVEDVVHNWNIEVAEEWESKEKCGPAREGGWELCLFFLNQVHVKLSSLTLEDIQAAD